MSRRLPFPKASQSGRKIQSPPANPGNEGSGECSHAPAGSRGSAPVPKRSSSAGPPAEPESGGCHPPCPLTGESSGLPRPHIAGFVRCTDTLRPRSSQTRLASARCADGRQTRPLRVAPFPTLASDGTGLARCGGEVAGRARPCLLSSRKVGFGESKIPRRGPGQRPGSYRVTSSPEPPDWGILRTPQTPQIGVREVHGHVASAHLTNPVGHAQA